MPRNSINRKTRKDGGKVMWLSELVGSISGVIKMIDENNYGEAKRSLLRMQERIKVEKIIAVVSIHD